ncbi:autotransporter outer membrane beta-barrel domain-containing protein [Burkholderia cepacia]|uniref:autotransporter outer membrane beta-barrel domain-containing protein n=1 Tax=Burkholderia cepacia TaxID=292 RepID=UPI002E791C12|nr:autotransporter outer membrane beta-barrel domain-containing protein [Burkholderia cepacia]
MSNIAWNNGNTFRGRIGARLRYAFDANGVSWTPYLRVNVLRVVRRRPLTRIFPGQATRFQARRYPSPDRSPRCSVRTRARPPP